MFARIAQAVQAAGSKPSREQDSADALLELATLVSAVLYTQGETGAAGTLEPIETVELHAACDADERPRTQAAHGRDYSDRPRPAGTGPRRLRTGSVSGHPPRSVGPASGSTATIPNSPTSWPRKVLPLYSGPGHYAGPALAKYDPRKAKPATHGGCACTARSSTPAEARDLVASRSGRRLEEEVQSRGHFGYCLGGRPEDVRHLLEQTTAKAAEGAVGPPIAALAEHRRRRRGRRCSPKRCWTAKTSTSRRTRRWPPAAADRLVHSVLAAAELARVGRFAEDKG